MAKSGDSMKISGRYFHRYLAAGFVIFAVGLVQYQYIYTLCSAVQARAVVAWGVNFLAATVWMHAIHWWFTFKKKSMHGYMHSLLKSYVSYGVSQSCGAVVIYVLCDLENIDHRMGFIFANVISSLVGYGLLKHYSMAAPSSA